MRIGLGNLMLDQPQNPLSSASLVFLVYALWAL
jgi:hypothetical protein